MLRRAPAVSFSSGELSLLSYRYVWPGVSALSLTHFLVYSFMLPETAGGNCSSRYEMMFKKIGEVNTAPLLTCQLDPVPSPGASSIWTLAHFEGNRKAGAHSHSSQLRWGSLWLALSGRLEGSSSSTGPELFWASCSEVAFLLSILGAAFRPHAWYNLQFFGLGAQCRGRSPLGEPQTLHGNGISYFCLDLDCT